MTLVGVLYSNCVDQALRAHRHDYQCFFNRFVLTLCGQFAYCCEQSEIPRHVS